MYSSWLDKCFTKFNALQLVEYEKVSSDWAHVVRLPWPGLMVTIERKSAVVRVAKLFVLTHSVHPAKPTPITPTHTNTRTHS